MKYYYKRIGDLRIDNDKTQKQIAEYLGITQQQYSLYETGEREIKTQQVIKLSQLYKVSIDYILGITNNKGGIGCDSSGAAPIEQQNNNYGSGTQINYKK